MTEEAEPLLTLKEVAVALGAPPSQVQRLLDRQPQDPTFKLGRGKKRYYTAAAAERVRHDLLWLAELREG